jgi:hypothetical protein
MPPSIHFLMEAPIALLAAAILIGTFFMTVHRRRERAHAGAGGSNFPPGVPPIGYAETFSLTGQTAALSTKTFYTAPVSGLYLLAMCCNIVTTNKAGSIALTLGTPHAGNIAIATQAGSGSITAIEQDPALGGSTAVDGYSAAVPCWMNAGDTATIAAAVSGLTGTTFNLFLMVQRLL